MFTVKNLLSIPFLSSCDHYCYLRSNTSGMIPEVFSVSLNVKDKETPGKFCKSPGVNGYTVMRSREVP